MATPDFSNFANKQPSAEKLVDYTLDDLTIYGVDPVPVFQVLSATQANKRYINHRLRDAAMTSKGRQRQIQAGRMNVDDLIAERQEDVVAFARHVIRGWRNVLDATGKEVQFNEENCRNLLQVLPDDVVDNLRTFCKNPANFVDLPVDVEGVAKNSPSA